MLFWKLKVKTPKEKTSKTSSQDEEEKSRLWPDTERTSVHILIT